MSLATDAIIDIRSSFEEFGTDITLVLTTEGAFDPLTGDTTDVTSSEQIKSLIRAYSSIELTNSEIHADDLMFRFYTTTEIDYNDTIIFDSVTYKILNIDKKILQGVNLFYTIRGRA